MYTSTELEKIHMTKPLAVALGNFDGIHVGHRELIRRTVAAAKSDGLKSAVFTFSNLPKNFFAANKVKHITYPEDKARIIESLGVDYLFNVPFTNEICTMPPVDFIERILAERLCAKEVFCGFNYTFGYKAEGDAEMLMREGLAREMGIHVVEPIKVDGEIVSSTRVRELIDEGDLEKASKLLGREYSIIGTVEVGNKLGRRIGFPTCNLSIDETMVTPPNGVYITRCTYDGVTYPAITNVGVKPTIGEFKKNIETNIFRFSKEIYGERIRVYFIKKLRDEKKFDSIDALRSEIEQNIITAKTYHRSHGNYEVPEE